MKRGRAVSEIGSVNDPDAGSTGPGYHSVRLQTERGIIECRYYEARGAHRGAVWVGGVGGGWDSPAQDLYPRLAEELVSYGIASLRVRYRQPSELSEAVYDVLAGSQFLASQGIDQLSLTGHSFGGAAAIQAAATTHAVRTVISIATQSFGAAAVASLAPRCSILLIHGTEDPVLPPACSIVLHRMAGKPRRLLLYPGAAHNLDEVASEVHQAVKEWILQSLPATT